MNNITICILMVFAMSSFTANSEETQIIIKNATLQETNLTLKLGDWSLQDSQILFEDGTPILTEGAPELLKLTTSIIIPDMAKMKIEVISSAYQDYHNIDIIPSKGNLYRDVDPSSIALKYGEVYQKDSFFPGELSELRTPHIIRDFRGQTVIFYPFQYNPIQKTLRVYS